MHVLSVHVTRLKRGSLTTADFDEINARKCKRLVYRALAPGARLLILRIQLTHCEV